MSIADRKLLPSLYRLGRAQLHCRPRITHLPTPTPTPTTTTTTTITTTTTTTATTSTITTVGFCRHAN